MTLPNRISVCYTFVNLRYLFYKILLHKNIFNGIMQCCLRLTEVIFLKISIRFKRNENIFMKLYSIEGTLFDQHLLEYALFVHADNLELISFEYKLSTLILLSFIIQKTNLYGVICKTYRQKWLRFELSELRFSYLFPDWFLLQNVGSVIFFYLIL